MLENISIERALIDMKIHVKWLEYQLIDELFLLNLYKSFSSSDDKSIEHYRYSAFRKVLQDNEGLSDLSIDNYINLAEIDDDRPMATAALMDLLRWPRLTDAQYGRLVNRSEFASQVFQNYHHNKSMIQTICKTPISDELINNCIQNYPGSVQEYLLRKDDIQRNQIEYIHQHGKTKRIRNIAKNMLGSKRDR
jgi:hypothetical protein